MIDTNALRGLIVTRGLTQEKVARYLEITPKTFYKKMKKGVFGSDEITKMMILLSIDDPRPIFFANLGTQEVPKDF